MSALLKLLFFVSLLHLSYATTLTKVILTDAVQKGAMCLDGSPPGYYIHHGTSTPNKWIIHLEGGGWCYDEDECVSRSKTTFGSSVNWPETYTYSGLLSDDCTDNPYFCGWSMVYVAYCDGASFSGNVDSPFVWNGTTLYFRGFKILGAVIDAILAVGGDDIEDVILTGCSAGGLATYLHADYVRSKIPSDIPVHAIADAGYFIDAPNINGTMYIRGQYEYLFNMQQCMDGVNQDCIAANTAAGEEWKCFMTQYTYDYIKTPMFLLNSRFDVSQLRNILQLDCIIPLCSEEQMMQFALFGEEFLKAALPAIQSPTNGVFINSCLTHCQTLNTITWSKFLVGNQTIRDTFYGWLTNDTAYSFKEVDHAYPWNPNCFFLEGNL